MVLLRNNTTATVNLRWINNVHVTFKLFKHNYFCLSYLITCCEATIEIGDKKAGWYSFKQNNKQKKGNA